MSRLSRPVVLGLAALGVVLAGIGDHLSGDDVAFTLIYLVPVALASWSGGRNAGLCLAVSATLSTALAFGTHSPPLSPTVRFWNLSTELGVFATLAVVLASLKRRLELESSRAQMDPLTGLKNRLAFREAGHAELERARRHGRPFTAALLDLDGFKQINDTLGHEAGDKTLAAVGAALRGRMRSVDVVARLGGDEFALLLPDTGAAEAAQLLGELLRLIPAQLRDRGWTVGLSLGAVTFDFVPEDLDASLREADARLYEAKRAGKGCLRLGSWPPAGS